MPMSFNPAVSAPGGMSYAAPLMDFMDIANLPNKYYEGVGNRQRQGLNDQAAQMNEQQQQINAQRIQQGQMAVDASRAVAGGDFRTKDGGIDYGKLVQTMLKYGDVNGLQQLAPLMMQQQAAGVANDPLLQPAAAAIPPARTVTAPANSPKGDAGTGTVASLVTDRLPNQDTTTGQTIAKIAQVLGVDPNANLTPGQITRAQGLLKQYAPQGASDGGGNLPPSANAVTPAPPSPAAAQPQQGAPNGAGSGQPLTPQEPLPPGFTDPMQAVGALQRRAAQIEAANPKAKPVAEALRAKAERILEGIKPVDVNPNTTRLNPQTGEKLYQGPAAAAIENSAHAQSSPTLDADAERYLQTGQLPPNLSKNLMGQAEARAIRDRATTMAKEQGINPADLPTKWQAFSADKAGQQLLSKRATSLTLAENEASSLIPRVREASARVKRTEYPTINALINASQKGSGGTEVIKLGIAVESLVPVYARVLKPVGDITVSDTQRAHELLDKAWSNGQINAALDQMQVELKSARTALDKTITESRQRKGAAAPEASAAPGKGSTNDDGWVNITTSDGKTVRVQEVK